MIGDQNFRFGYECLLLLEVQSGSAFEIALRRLQITRTGEDDPTERCDRRGLSKWLREFVEQAARLIVVTGNSGKFIYEDRVWMAL